MYMCVCLKCIIKIKKIINFQNKYVIGPVALVKTNAVESLTDF